MKKVWQKTLLYSFEKQKVWIYNFCISVQIEMICIINCNCKCQKQKKHCELKTVQLDQYYEAHDANVIKLLQLIPFYIFKAEICTPERVMFLINEYCCKFFLLCSIVYSSHEVVFIDLKCFNPTSQYTHICFPIGRGKYSNRIC